MTAFPDTSFLCALYVRQDNSTAAAAHFASLPEALVVSSLLLFEFRQSVRFQIWRHRRDKSRGYPEAQGRAVIAQLQTNLDAGSLIMVSVDWPDVHRLAETLSERHTIASGHQSLDVLHVATALHLGARDFLTFDANQRRLCAAEKLKVRP